MTINEIIEEVYTVCTPGGVYYTISKQNGAVQVTKPSRRPIDNNKIIHISQHQEPIIMA